MKSYWKFVLSPMLILLLSLCGKFAAADDTADTKATAVDSMKTWLLEIDQSKYEQSWTDASPAFQKAVTSAQWAAAAQSVRDPLGKCTSRVLASAMQQTQVGSPGGVQKGDFVVAQFNTSFENLAYALETVCFQKTADGGWKAAGYYVKPRP